ncbi:MAG: hypothetical protein ACYC2T_04825 [Bacillota bacterium]
MPSSGKGVSGLRVISRNRMKPKGKTIFMIGALVLFLVWRIAGSTPADAELVQAFTALDRLDFQAQAAAADQKKSEQMIRQVYTKPQSEQALKYLAELRVKKVKLRVASVNYKDISVLDKKRSFARLSVYSRVLGGFYTTWDPEMLVERVDNQSKYEVILRKIKGQWLISEVIYP